MSLGGGGGTVVTFSTKHETLNVMSKIIIIYRNDIVL